MLIFEIIGEIFGHIFLDAIIRIPVKIYEWFTGKETGLFSGYKTEKKKFIKFNTAKKFILAWESIEQIKSKIAVGLDAIDEQFHIVNFEFKIIDQMTIVQPPASISFYSYHFLVQWLAENNGKSIGIVETTRTAYTTYYDPDSENLIGQTDKGEKFFISLTEDYSKAQFLRVNSTIKTNEEYDVARIKRDLARGRNS